MQIKIKKLDESAQTPQQSKQWDAGYDLYSIESGHLLPKQRALIRTGISIAIPPGYYGRIAPRSGLAVKSGIDVLAGVIDSTYRGEVKVALINLCDGDAECVYSYKVGDRIAQLIIEKCHDVEWQVTDSLEQTNRSAGGFGSTGQ